MLKALITGGCGFIGYNLVLALESDPWQAWDVIVIDDLSSGLRSNHVKGVDYIHESILKEGLLDTVVSRFMPDVIFHLAAIPRVSFSVKHPVETFNANVLGTLKVLESVRKSKLPHACRIINTSSSSIYGDSAPRPTHRLTPGNPQSPYALDKWQAEEWCRMYAKLYNLDVVSLRYFNVFGPHSRFGGAYSTVMSAWLYSLFVDPSVTPYLEGDGLQSRDFCFVENVVKANLLCQSHIARFEGESFNVAQGQSHTLLQLKEIIEQATGKIINLERRPERVGDVKHTLADITDTCNILGYDPRRDFVNQVKIMADWYATSYSSPQI